MLRCIAAAATHVGKVRRVNEDAFLDHSEIGLWAVADGVGGAAAGDRASRLVIEALQSVSPPVSAADFLAEVCSALQAANRSIQSEAASIGAGVMGSTVVTLLIFDRSFACVWAGDSRLYLLRQGELYLLSRDHSEVQELVDAGVIDAAAARTHPRANVITRAVGVSDHLDLDKVENPIAAGDTFLLCSDGLTKPLSDMEIASLLADERVDVSAASLIEAALDRGAPDNVTVVVVKAVADPPNHAASRERR